MAPRHSAAKGAAKFRAGGRNETMALITRKASLRPPAVVIGLDCVTGLQTARILAYRHFVPVVGIARDRRHPCCRTRSCEKIFFADTSNQDFIDLLVGLGPTLSAPSVLYPCTDLSVLLISRFRKQLAPWYRMVLPAANIVETLVDKVRFCAYAQEHGFAVPKTFSLGNLDDVDRAARELTFPCIVKPSVKTPAWEEHTAAKGFRVASAEGLFSLYERCSGWAELLLAQNWIEGNATNLFTCNCYFDAGSRPQVTFVTRKLRQWPIAAGTGCFGQECRNDAVLQETVRFFQTASLRGFGYLEMKRDAQTGEYLLIEPNIGRPTGRSATAEAAGVDYLRTHYCEALGWPLPRNRHQKYEGVKWIYFRRDLQSSFALWRQRKLTFRDWCESLRNGRKVDALFSWRDPAPFMADFLKGFRALASDKTNKRRFETVNDPDQAAQADSSTQPSRSSVVDFDIHGLAGVRLINPSRGDFEAVRRQLGLPVSNLERKPDILVRFVQRIPVPGLIHVEFGKSGFTRDSFYILQSRKRAARVRIDFSEVGGDCELLCQTGLRSVPLLPAILGLSLLKKKAVLVHASAFVYEGTGVLVAGWAKGGKTEALLAFTRQEAQYIGDEWVVLAADGQRMCGIPEHIRLQDWHLAELPRLWSHVSRTDRLLFQTIHWIDWLHRRIPDRLASDSLLLGRIRDAMPALRRQMNVQLDPRLIFGANLAPRSAAPEKIFLMVSHADQDIRVEPADPAEIAERMSVSVHYEQLPLFAGYLAYQYAFPKCRNEFIEQARELQRDLLRRALAGKDAYIVRHPYPCSFAELFEEMRPYCTSATKRVGAGDEQSVGARFQRASEFQNQVLVPPAE